VPARPGPGTFRNVAEPTPWLARLDRRPGALTALPAPAVAHKRRPGRAGASARDRYDFPVIVREANPQDEARLTELAESAPGGGASAFRREYHVPAGQIAGDHEASERFVAEADGVIVGTARLDVGTCRFEGDDVRYALLGSLQVHSDYRGQGVAALLTDRRLARATELGGDDVVAVAYIQSGNSTSLPNAREWATQIGGHLVVTPVPVRSRPPSRAEGLTVRPAAEAELGAIAAAVDEHYAGHDFARRWDTARLAGWLAASPFPDPVNHYLVATDQSGRLLAGLGLREEGRLTSLVVRRLPLHLRAANALLHVVPSDHRVRNLVIDKAWFAPGRLDAARYLWEMTRWEWREAGTSLLLTHDPRSPVGQIVSPRPWLPTTSATIAVRSRRPMRQETLVEQL
jgi:predicted N-acetyltransferase YhbS